MIKSLSQSSLNLSHTQFLMRSGILYALFKGFLRKLQPKILRKRSSKERIPCKNFKGQRTSRSQLNIATRIVTRIMIVKSVMLSHQRLKRRPIMSAGQNQAKIVKGNLIKIIKTLKRCLPVHKFQSKLSAQLHYRKGVRAFQAIKVLT